MRINIKETEKKNDSCKGFDMFDVKEMKTEEHLDDLCMKMNNTAMPYGQCTHLADMIWQRSTVSSEVSHPARVLLM